VEQFHLVRVEAFSSRLAIDLRRAAAIRAGT